MLGSDAKVGFPLWSGALVANADVQPGLHLKVWGQDMEEAAVENASHNQSAWWWIRRFGWGPGESWRGMCDGGKWITNHRGRGIQGFPPQNKPIHNLPTAGLTTWAPDSLRTETEACPALHSLHPEPTQQGQKAPQCTFSCQSTPSSALGRAPTLDWRCPQLPPPNTWWRTHASQSPTRLHSSATTTDGPPIVFFLSMASEIRHRDPVYNRERPLKSDCTACTLYPQGTHPSILSPTPVFPWVSLNGFLFTRWWRHNLGGYAEVTWAGGKNVSVASLWVLIEFMEGAAITQAPVPLEREVTRCGVTRK